MAVTLNKRLQSDLAREMADTFIQRLNQPPHERQVYKVIFGDRVSIRLDLNAVNAKGKTNLEDIIQHIREWPQPPLAEDNPFYILGQGNHNCVLGHREISRVVTKLMRKEDAEKQRNAAKKANELASDQNFAFCNFPDAAYENLDHPKYSAAYIESRLPLKMGMGAHDEFWARIFTHFHSAEATPLFKENLIKTILEIQAFILTVGFWDIGSKNCPEMGIDGIAYALDFENIDEANCSEGLQRLARLLPLDEVAAILRPSVPNCLESLNASIEMRNQRLIEMKMPYNTTSLQTEENLLRRFDSAFSQGRFEVNTLAEALHFYDQKGWISELEDKRDYDEGWEADLLSRQSEPLRKPLRDIIKVMRHQLTIFSDDEVISRRRNGILNVEKEAETHEEHIQAFECLKAEGVIASYFADEAFSNMRYSFYF